MTELKSRPQFKDLINDVSNSFRELTIHDRIGYSPSIGADIDTGSKDTLKARVAIAALTGLVFAAERARNAATLAQSWRNFNVGATAAMYNYSTGRFGYLDGYNVKPSKEGGLNLHAEQIALSKGRSNSLNRLVGIAIYADPNDEDSNPNRLNTLPPCDRCINMMTSAPEVDDRTLILGTNQDLSLCELYTFGSLTGKESAFFKLPAFSLKNDSDLEIYDKEIQPIAMSKIFRLFGLT